MHLCQTPASEKPIQPIHKNRYLPFSFNSSYQNMEQLIDPTPLPLTSCRCAANVDILLPPPSLVCVIFLPSLIFFLFTRLCVCVCVLLRYSSIYVCCAAMRIYVCCAAMRLFVKSYSYWVGMCWCGKMNAINMMSGKKYERRLHIAKESERVWNGRQQNALRRDGMGLDLMAVAASWSIQ